MHVDSIFESVNKAHASSSTWSATLIKIEQKGDVVVHWYSARFNYSTYVSKIALHFRQAWRQRGGRAGQLTLHTHIRQASSYRYE